MYIKLWGHTYCFDNTGGRHFLLGSGSASRKLILTEAGLSNHFNPMYSLLFYCVINVILQYILQCRMWNLALKMMALFRTIHQSNDDFFFVIGCTYTVQKADIDEDALGDRSSGDKASSLVLLLGGKM